MEDELIRESDESSDQQDDDSQPSFEDFRQANDDYEATVQHGTYGTARLLSAELVDHDEVPSEYTDQFHGLADHYLQFDAELVGTDRNVTVMCPARDDGINVQTALDWAGARSIDGLAGQHIPIRHIDNDVYRVETFTRGTGGPDLGGLPVQAIKSLKDHGLLEFNGGEWTTHWWLSVAANVGFLVGFGLVLISLVISPLLFFGLVFGLGVGAVLYQLEYAR